MDMQLIVEGFRNYINDIEDDGNDRDSQVIDDEDDEEKEDLETVEETAKLPDEELKRRRKAREKKNDQKERSKAIRGDPYGYKDYIEPLQRGIVVNKEAKEKKTKNAGPGNPYHSGRSGKVPGGFTNPEEESGSWSLYVDGPHKAGKQSGQARRPSANKKQVITKRRCGRGPGGKGKAKYRCADGSKTSVNEEMMKVDIIYLRNIIRQELTKLLGSQAKRRACSLADLVKAQDLWARSEKGEAFATKAKS